MSAAWSALRRRWRIAWLNTRPGIRIASSAWLAASARLQTESDGHAFGGRIVIGEGVTLSDGAILATYGGSIELQPGVYVGPYCVLYGHGGLAIGRNTMIGAHTVIVAANHGFARTDVPMNAQPLTREGITIEDDVWLGAGCQVLDGVRIGHGAVIGAGSVVTRDVGPFSVAAGVPAAVLRSRAGATMPSARR